MINLKKVHGSQNSFFILDQTLLTTPLTEQELVTLTKTLTTKTSGILGGSDGVLVVQKSSTPNTVAQMRVINADGSEASMCGNGLRTVARELVVTVWHEDEVAVVVHLRVVVGCLDSLINGSVLAHDKVERMVMEVVVVVGDVEREGQLLLAGRAVDVAEGALGNGDGHGGAYGQVPIFEHQFLA